MAPALSAFEAKRQANVASNKKLLKETAEIGSKMKRAAAPVPKVSVPRKRKAAAAEPTPKTRVMPTRSSRRLAGGDASEGIKIEDIPIEIKDREPKRTRIGGDMDLSSLQVGGSRWSDGDALASFKRGAEPGVRTFINDDIKEEEDDDKLTSLRKDMSELNIYEGWLPNDIKITPERVYALTFHPIQDKPLVLAGDKKGTLGIFDASQPPPEYDEDDEDAKIPLPKVAAFELHTRTISSIKAPMFDHNSVFTSSYDSSIRCLDLPTQVSSQLWQPDDDGTDLGISCIDVSAEAKDIILFSTLDGSVGRLDRRAKGTTDIWQLTDNKIGGFSIHPLLPHLLATASLDRTLKIWDTRMIKGKGESAHPTLLGEHTSRLSVSHVSWSRGGRLATSSYDDTVKIYDMSTATLNTPKHKAGTQISEADMEPTHSIRHNNQTGRWVTILKPQWQINPADGIEKFAIANMNRFVDIFDGNGKQLAQLEGEGITAVPAVAEFHPRHNWVAGGTGSGKLCLWM